MKQAGLEIEVTILALRHGGSNMMRLTQHIKAMQKLVVVIIPELGNQKGQTQGKSQTIILGAKTLTKTLEATTIIKKNMWSLMWMHQLLSISDHLKFLG